MRVGIVHYTAPPVTGGVESIIGAHCRLLAEHGHQVTVVAGRGRSRPGYEFVRIPLLAATHPRQRALAAGLGAGTVPAAFAGTVSSIEAELRPALDGCDAVIVHNAYTLHFNLALTSALTALAAGPFSERMVAWTHDVAAVNALYRDELHPGYPWDLIDRPQPGCRYVCISEQRRHELFEAWSGRDDREVEIIPNGIDPLGMTGAGAALLRLAERYDLIRRYPVLLLPVRVTRRKNIELAIEVVAELRKAGQNPLLMVTGPVRGHHPARSRDYLAELQTLTARLGVEPAVVFLATERGGALNDDEVAQLYRLSDLLIMPSQSEGFGLPVLEAAVNRLPVVASRLPVFGELAGNAITYFEPSASAASIAGLVLETLSERPARLRRRVLADFAWNAIYEHGIAPLLVKAAGAGPRDA